MKAIDLRLDLPRAKEAFEQKHGKQPTTALVSHDVWEAYVLQNIPRQDQARHLPDPSRPYSLKKAGMEIKILWSSENTLEVA